MKKSTMILIALVAIVAIWGVSAYNGLVKMDESVNTAWSNVENQYQRRADLIPNLVSTVKGYAAHEKETLEAVLAARSKATQMTIDADNLTPEKLQEYQKAQGEIGAALGRLLAITEAYPDLVARSYNTSIRTFPKTIIAGMCGFDKRPYFEAEEGANKAPEVQF